MKKKKFRLKNTKYRNSVAGLVFAIGSSLCPVPSSLAFDRLIAAELIRGAETNTLLYTVSPDHLRIENVATNWPHPINLVDLDSGALTLVYPHNRSFVRLPSSDTRRGSHDPAAPTTAGFPTVPNNGDLRLNEVRGRETHAQPVFPLPPCIGPQPGVGPGIVNIPGIQAMPMMPAEKLDLKATGETTNLLGFACARYELKQRGETLAIWATDKLLPFQPYRQNQPHRFGPRMIDEQWSEMLRERKLFPMLASLRYDNSGERFRFEVKSVKEKTIADPDLGIGAGPDGNLFQPPPDYNELQPLPF